MEPPAKPQDSDCCNSGCTPCIFDVYEEQLGKYLNKFKEYEEEISRNKDNCLSPSSYSIFHLIDKEQHTPNSFILKFEYCPVNENERMKVLKYKPGQHFLLKGRDSTSDDEFTRAYTPIPYGDNNGTSFTILIRLYDGGKMSFYLQNLQLGCETLWRGPYGDFTIDYTMKNMLFVAQGTGIAPIYAIIKEMLLNDACNIFLHLFFCCRSVDEIFLRNELYQFKAHWNFNYEVFLKDSTNLLEKYEEVVHTRKLEKSDVDNFVTNKKESNLQVIICGSKDFGDCIASYVHQNGIKDNIIMFE